MGLPLTAFATAQGGATAKTSTGKQRAWDMQRAHFTISSYSMNIYLVSCIRIMLAQLNFPFTLHFI